MSRSLATDGNFYFFVNPARHTGGFVEEMGTNCSSRSNFHLSLLILALIWSRNGGEAERGPDKEKNGIQSRAQCSEDAMNAQLKGSRGYGVTQEKPLWHDVNKEKKRSPTPLPESDRGLELPATGTPDPET